MLSHIQISLKIRVPSHNRIRLLQNISHPTFRTSIAQSFINIKTKHKMLRDPYVKIEQLKEKHFQFLIFLYTI